MTRIDSYLRSCRNGCVTYDLGCCKELPDEQPEDSDNVNDGLIDFCTKIQLTQDNNNQILSYVNFKKEVVGTKKIKKNAKMVKIDLKTNKEE